MLRKIIGSIVENGMWRWKKNRESYQVYKEHSIVSYKIVWLRWLGHILRMVGSTIVKKIYKGTIGGVLSRGRSKSRWRGSMLRVLSQVTITQSTWEMLLPQWSPTFLKDGTRRERGRREREADRQRWSTCIQIVYMIESNSLTDKTVHAYHLMRG